MCKRIFGRIRRATGIERRAAAQATAPQTTPPQTAPAQTTPAQTCSLPAVADTVALNPVPGSDLVTVPVEINGKPKQFLLDIGTNASEVSQATVDELHLIEGLKRTETFQSGPATQSDLTSNRNVLVGATVQATLVDVKGAHNVDDGRARVNIPSFTMGNRHGQKSAVCRRQRQ